MCQRSHLYREPMDIIYMDFIYGSTEWSLDYLGLNCPNDPSFTISWAGWWKKTWPKPQIGQNIDNDSQKQK